MTGTTSSTTNSTTNSTDQAQGAGDYAAVKTFRSSPDSVLAALRTTDAISAWWGPASGSAAEGGRFRADFGEGRHHDIVVVAQEPGRVEWRSAGAPHHPLSCKRRCRHPGTCRGPTLPPTARLWRGST